VAGGAGAAGDRVPPSALLLFSGVTLAWGVTWPVNKIALDEIPPWSFRSITTVAGAAILFLLAFGAGQGFAVARERWAALVAVSLLNTSGWHILSAYGIALMGSGRSVVIAYTMPVWASILGALFLDEPLTGRRILALALGMAGIALLLDDGARSGGAVLGAGLTAGAAVSWAAGVVVMKRLTWGVPPLAFAAWQLAIGAAPLAAVALVHESAGLGPVSDAAVAACVFNILGPVAFGYYAWVRIVSLVPAAVAAIGTLLTPVVGVIASALMLGEAFGLREAASLLLVCAGIGLVLMPAGSGRRRR
jgi:drug/metabolite transporter (DMT)-like permease